MYGLEIWGDDNFIIQGDTINVNYKSSPSLLEITQYIRNHSIKGPLLLRFDHLIKKQINTLYNSFNDALKENDYTGSFNAVYPLKVNQYPSIVSKVIQHGKAYNYGLEAGSKAELLLAMTLSDVGAPITVNGFKDAEMIQLGFIAAQMGHNITITIEGLGELETILHVASSTSLKMPHIGIRVRLHSGGSGSWAKSGGMDAKFGLTSTELLKAIKLLKKSNSLEYFSMLHFHIGSQLEDIAPLKKALREAGNIYAELKKMGADALSNINIGGGLAVEYSQNNNERVSNYTLSEFANDVVYLLKEIMNAKGVKHPNIFTESGRYIVASSTVLITPVLELFSQDYDENSLLFKENNPPLIEELRELNELISTKNSIEYLHDALDHKESLFTLFDLGYIDLQDRCNAEILTHHIVKKALLISKNNPTPEITRLQTRMQERYLINASIFQSIPDYWGLSQHFPIMPLHHLKTSANRAATILDITCDSDGEIAFNSKKPLYLHDIDLDKDEYFLGIFSVGAYQETLGMHHNLFAHPSECSITINDEGFEIENLKESSSVFNVLNFIGYNSAELLIKLKNQLSMSDFSTEQEKNDTLQKLELYLHQNGYLRTTN